MGSMHLIARQLCLALQYTQHAALPVSGSVLAQAAGQTPHCYAPGQSPPWDPPLGSLNSRD